jgi:hypothetical protein
MVIISSFALFSLANKIPVAMTRAKRNLVRPNVYPLQLTLPNMKHIYQCIVGDSSTIVNGGRYLKKWITWLEANADVRYAGLD